MKLKSHGSGGDVLLVDDSSEDLRAIEALLEERGYRVRIVSDPQEAVAVATRQPPELLLIGVEQRGVSGYEVCRKLKSQPATADVPVVFLAPLNELEDLAAGFEAGGVAYLRKPVRPVELLASVRTHIELLRSRKVIERHAELLEQRVARRTAALQESNHELRESELRFRSLMDQSPLAIEILSPDGWIQEVNPAWYRLWRVEGKTGAQVLERYNMLADEQAEELGVGPLIRKAFGGEPVILPPIEYSSTRTTEELGLEDFGGRSPWIQCHLYPVRDSKGAVVYVVNTYVEVTQLKRAEQEATEQREALARMDRASRMGQLTGSIAHELNQPLTGVLSNAQAAELMIESGRWEPGEVVGILAEIVADTKRARDVISGLRDLYREQKGELRPVDVNAVVRKTVLLMRSEFALKHIEVTTECAPSVHEVRGNPVQIQQVLVNLLVNASQAMAGLRREDRLLRVSTANDVGVVKAWVEDRGPGIDPDTIDRIFEPLATWKPGGTGMGLAVSNSIIGAHGGQMWAENMPGGGARLGFSVPVPGEDDGA